MIEQENQLRNKSRQKGRRSSGVETKELILGATREVAVKYGVSQLTIDAVAEAAGVSKGGVLYHFPSKKSLITALMQQYVDHLSQELETALSHQKGKSYHGTFTVLVPQSISENTRQHRGQKSNGRSRSRSRRLIHAVSLQHFIFF